MRIIVLFLLLLVGNTAVWAKENTSTALKLPLWEVQWQGKTAYLFGTMHFGVPEMYPLPDYVYKKLSASNILITEVDIRPEKTATLFSLIQTEGIDLSKPLSQRVPKDLYAQWQAYLKAKNIPEDMFQPMKTWLATLTLSVLQLKAAGFDETLGVEAHLYKEANKHQLSLGFLETPESQIKALSSLSDEHQYTLMRSTLEMKEGDFANMLNAWKSGKVNDFMESYLGGTTPEFAKAFVKILLDDRNQVMANGVIKSMKEGKTPFVAVGAAHLDGANSVIKLLEKQGAKVVDVQHGS